VFQSNTSFSMAPADFLKVCPIYLHFPFLIWMSIDSCFVISHRVLFDILSGHLMFKISLKHLFTKLCSLFMLVFNTLHVSQALVLKIDNLIFFEGFLFFYT
jgi:hypothetical protein